MPSVTKTLTKIINETDYATLAAGASTSLANCTRIDLTKATQCILAIDADTVPASVTLTISLYPSHDGENFDDTPWACSGWTGGEWTSTADKEQQHSPEISPAPKYLKVIVTNESGSDAVTNLRVYSIVQTVG